MQGKVKITSQMESLLVIGLEDINGIKPKRIETLSPQRKQINIPMDYAMSIITNYGLRSMLEAGYFTIECDDVAIKSFIEEGVIADKEELLGYLSAGRSDEEILAMLKDSGNFDVDKELEAVDAVRVVNVAAAHNGELTRSVTDKIEQKIGHAISAD